jgi:hypothetical protein
MATFAQPPFRWPSLDEEKAHPDVIFTLRQLVNGLNDHEQAFQAISAAASLVATVNSGVITAVDVVSAGKYSKVPSVSAIGGGGTGASFQVKLNRDGGISSVSVINGGSGYTSPPALSVG